MAKYIYKFEEREDSLGRKYYLERKTGKRVKGTNVLQYKQEQDARLRAARVKGGKTSYSQKWKTNKGRWLTNKEKAKLKAGLEEYYEVEKLNPNQYKTWTANVDETEIKKIINLFDGMMEMSLFTLADTDIGTKASSGDISITQRLNMSKSVNASVRFNGELVSYKEFENLIHEDYKEAKQAEIERRSKKGKEGTVYKVYVIITVDNDFNMNYNAGDFKFY